MKKLLKQIDKEKLFAGIFGLIALVAIFFEMQIANFASDSIAGAMKDIAGTALDIVMLIVAIDVLRPKKKKIGGFEETFNQEMDKIVSKYSPLITKDTNARGIYNIADDMAVLYQSIDCKYHKLFDFDYTREISFFVRKTLFMGRTKADFSTEQKTIVDTIATKVTGEYEILKGTYKPTQDGFKLTFSHDLISSDDARKVAEVIDKIILLYIVEYKK